MIFKYEFVVIILVLIRGEKLFGKKVHVKIIVPQLIKTHTHTRLIFVHPPKPKKPSYPYKDPNYHHYDVADAFNYKKFPKPYPTGRTIYPSHQYVPAIENPPHKLITVTSRPIIVVDPSDEETKYPENPVEDKYEKLIKQHKYKDISDYKKYHKKEEYDLKKGKTLEHLHKGKFKFGNKKGKHDKKLYDHSGHMYKSYKQMHKNDMKNSPFSQTFTESSSDDINIGYGNAVTHSYDDGGEYQVVSESPREEIQDPNNYVYDSDAFLEVNPNNDETFKNAETDYISNDNNENPNVHNQYEVTLNDPRYSVTPAEVMVDATELPTAPAENTAPAESPEDNGGKEENRWSDGYDNTKEQVLKSLQQDEEQPLLVENEEEENNKNTYENNNGSGVDQEGLVNTNQNNDNFMNWAVKNGAFGLGYGKSEQNLLNNPDSADHQDQISENNNRKVYSPCCNNESNT